MLTAERKALIQRVLQRDGRLIAKSFSQEIGISEDTIRRDLRELAAEGLLQRVHGGALPASSAEADFASRQAIGASAKSSLGRAAARLIARGQIVFLDGGTSNIQLARQIPLDLRATVITHSPSIAVELAGHPSIEVEMIGGRLFKHSIVTVGSTSAEAIARIQTDIFFMGVTGLHPEIGATTGDAEEASIKRLISRQAGETIVIATKEKLGAASPYQIVPMSEITTVITEGQDESGQLDQFKSAAVTVVEVDD
ncbi:DeoR/GlpR family DNA-binding transcription regulator [Neorhizobium sp. JUb45]|uniref:DeoR/GlpR family DNA-binding transcription regulator n=1 Tax=Neorhizobium sp. JUb45 TaxID=2485113 RepID=UPI0010495229|nr:DeoR/GlpR family DNA-binding transcription regulator [Neorhizobium sp. JUb45]TCR00467.1 DeoR family transcriptional regulator [Neorhizobium sp. JUb45]